MTRTATSVASSDEVFQRRDDRRSDLRARALDQRPSEIRQQVPQVTQVSSAPKPHHHEVAAHAEVVLDGAAQLLLRNQETLELVVAARPRRDLGLEDRRNAQPLRNQAG